MTEQLKPCPFCEGVNVIHSGYRMYCHACGAEGPDADSADESAAIAAWNRRDQPTQPGAEPAPSAVVCGRCDGTGLDARYCNYQCEKCDGSGQAGAEPVAWQGGEGWESLAWELCADENGEESCDELVWEGGPIPEPWGDRWMKYEGEAKRLIALVHKHTAPLYTHPPARVPLTDEELRMISKQQDPVVVLHHNVLAFAHAIIAAYEAKNGIKGAV